MGVSLLTDARRHVAHWQQRLALRDWEFSVAVVDVPHGESDAWATCSTDPLHRLAEIQVDRFIPPDQLRCVMAHEVLHVVFRPMDDVARDEGIENRAFDRAEETAINRIAEALCAEVS